jgi:hypothetical protein
MVVLLGPAQYDAVRKAIRLDMDATDVPDSAIELDIYAGEAEREVRVLDSNVDAYLGTQLRRAEAAATYLCAALLADALPNITGESYGGGYSWRMEGWNPQERAAWLRWLAYEQIAANLDIEPLDLIGRLPVFDLADAGPPGAERGAFPSLGTGVGNSTGGTLGWW